MTTVRYESRAAVAAERLFAFHADVANLPRISPPVPRVTLVGEHAPTYEGQVQRIVLGVGPVRVRWDAEIARFEPPRLIEDRMVRGPFRRWRHQHRVEEDGEGAVLIDVVTFRLVPTRMGAVLEWWLVRPGLWLMFAWRHWRTRVLVSANS